MTSTATLPPLPPEAYAATEHVGRGTYVEPASTADVDVDDRINACLLTAAVVVDSAPRGVTVGQALRAALAGPVDPLGAAVTTALLGARAGDAIGLLLEEALAAARAIGTRSDSHDEHLSWPRPDGTCDLCDDDRLDGLHDALAQLRHGIGDSALRDLAAAL